MTRCVPDFDSGQFDSGAVAVTSAVAYVEVARISVPRRTVGGNVLGELAVYGLVGAGGALGHLKLTAAATVNGTHFNLLADTDFDTATDICPHAGPSSPPTIYQTAAGSAFNMLLAGIGAYAEVSIWAQKATADTTLTLSGRFR